MMATLRLFTWCFVFDGDENETISFIALFCNARTIHHLWTVLNSSLFICMIFECSMVNLNPMVKKFMVKDKKDAHLTADMSSHLFSLFQALLPEQFDLSFIINICTAVKTKQMPFQ